MTRLRQFFTALFCGQPLPLGLGLLLGANVLTGLVACQGSAPLPPAQQGQQLVQTYGCATCHEPTGMQGGVLSGQQTPRPGTTAYGANLTPDPTTGIGSWTDAQITSALRQGVDDENMPLCPTMPRFSNLTDEEVNAIIAYLRSLPAINRAIPASVCPPTKT